MIIKVVLTFVVVVAGVYGEEAAANCNDHCGNFFKQKGNNLVDACEQGCKLYQNSNLHPTFGSLSFFTNGDESLLKCWNGCDPGYDVNMKTACRKGCEFGKEEGSKDDLFNFGDGGFSISFGPLPGMDDISGIFNKLHNDMKEQGKLFQDNMGVFRDEMKEKVDDTKDQMGDHFDSIGSAFKRFHENVKKMMSFMNGSPTSDVNMLPVGSGEGELTVIKSGPGYHEEKTYHIGPNANIEKILESSSINDMLQHDNPIEKFMDKDQVEVFDPIKVTSSEDGNEFLNVVKSIVSKIAQPFTSKNDVVEESEELDGPRLPETGLRSNPFRLGFEDPFEQESSEFDMKNLLIVGEKNICYSDPSTMSWSDWLSCLHVRMGLPNWLLAATVAMGVLFTLWICLMIPSNAPKQKVRKQANVGTKEVEAGKVAVVTLTTKDGHIKGLLDLPPSYDDITKDEKVVVNLEPVHGAKAKIPMEDDDEITEPLPQKKDDQNQSIV